MPKHMRVNVDAFEEEGNRGGGNAINYDDAFKNPLKNLKQVENVYMKWKQLKKAKTVNGKFQAWPIPTNKLRL